MNVDAQKELTRDKIPFCLLWRNGGLDVSSFNYTESNSGVIPSYDRQYSAVKSALSEIEMVFAHASNGISGMLSLIPLAKGILSDLRADMDRGLLRHSAKQLDLFLEQIAQIARDSELGGINLLHYATSKLRIPYFTCDIVADDDCYHLKTLGVSISPIYEKMTRDDQARFTGFCAVSASNDRSVLWMNSIDFWMDNMADEEWNQQLFLDEINSTEDQLLQFENMLIDLNSQFNQYTKMVGETITDHVIKIC